MLRNRLKRKIKKAIKNLEDNGKLPEANISKIKIEVPTRKEQGDYSTSVAMQIASFSGKKPKTVAKIIQKELSADKKLAETFSEIKVAPPGFVNFYVSENYLRKFLWKIYKAENFGKVNIGRNSRLNLEFGSINPTGQLHVGHARTFFYSDALANILKFAGFRVVKEYYVNNAKQSAQIKELGKTVLGNGTSYKGPYLDKKIKENAKSLKKYKSYGAAGYFMAGKIQKDIKEFLEKEAGIEFDVWFEEEGLYKKGDISATLRELKKKDLVYKKDGATWLKTSKFGDRQDQVIIRSSGENSYFISDIAYHRNKAKRKFSRFIDVWGADHHGHLRRMNAALKILKIKKVDILIAQLVRLKGGAKLSKRKGNIVTVKDLIDQVGLDSVRYFYITKSLDSQMEFDIDLAKKQSQKNPVYYIQYTHARICSILRKTSASGDGLEIKKKHLEALQKEGEFGLIRKLMNFPEIIEDTAKDYQVHRIATYLHQLAQEFNQFYRDFRVIGEDDKVETARLALAIVTGATIKQGLDLLGISAPEKM